MNQPLFIIIFEDESYFLGGTSYFDTGWLEMPLKKISRIFYKLPTGDYICLHGYDKYFHMIEALEDITGEKKGIIRLQYAYIMGKKGNKVISYRITLISKEDDKFRHGDITTREFDIEDKQIKKLNKNNWR